MKLKIIFISILFSTFNYSIAQTITPIQIERAQEIVQKEEALRKKIEQPQKVFVKEIILPQGCLIPEKEIAQITGNFAGRWHSLKEKRELLDILTQAYRKAYPGSEPLQATCIIEESKLVVSFE